MTTLTVKELILELMEYDMRDPVFIGIGNEVIASDHSEILQVTNARNSDQPFGVYVVPRDSLKK